MRSFSAMADRKAMKPPYVGWPGSGLCITVRIMPAKDGWDGRPSWEKIDILDIGEIWEILDDEIERRCKAEDAKCRRAAAHKKRSPRVAYGSA